MAVFIHGFKAAKKAYQKNMLASNTLTTIALLGAGDIISQYIETKLAESTLKGRLGEIAATNMEFSTTSKMLIPLSANKSTCTVKQLNQCHENTFLAKYDWTRTGKI